MTNLHKADLEFFEEAKQVFEANARMETYRNQNETLIALRRGPDRDCIQVFQLGEEVAFIHQYMQAAPLVVNTEPPEEKPERTTPGGMKGRRIGKTYMRSIGTVREDENLVVSFLKAIEDPKGSLLRDIVAEMKRKGRIHWSFPSTSPSSYMSTMIKNGKPVEKVEYGRYRYKGGEEL